MMMMEVDTNSSSAIKRPNKRPSRSQRVQRRAPSEISAEFRSESLGYSSGLCAVVSATTAGLPQRGVKMFRVLVEPPSTGVFFSGSEIRGCLQVTTEEQKKFRYIHVSLTGRAQVWWTDSSSQKEYGVEKEHLHETQMLWTKEDGSDGLALFPAGAHNFPFQFLLPLRTPSSFEGRVGSVRYELLGRIVTGVMRVEHSVEMEIPVMEILDINQHPLLLGPKSVQVHKKVWSFPCTLARVTMVVGLSRSGFCVGEDIPLNIALENGSRYEVTIEAVLRQKITYTAKKNRREYDKATVVRVVSQRFAPRTSTIWPTNLRVSVEEATTQDYQPIHIAYRIKVVASVGWGQSLVARIPITIGNIPFRESLVDKDLHNSRDHLQFGNHADHCLFSSLDDRSSRKYGADSQLEPTRGNLPLSVSQESCDVFSSSDSCFHDSQCTYSVRDYVDAGDLSDDDLCPSHHGN